MITLETRFLALLRGRITDTQENQVGHLVAGRASTFDDYRHRVGIIAGLAEALKLAEEVEKTLNGPESTKPGTKA